MGVKSIKLTPWFPFLYLSSLAAGLFIPERCNKSRGRHNSRKGANCKAIGRPFNWDTSLARLGQKTSSSIHSRTRTRFEGAADFDPKPRSGSSIRGYHSSSCCRSVSENIPHLHANSPSNYTPVDHSHSYFFRVYRKLEFRDCYRQARWI